MLPDLSKPRRIFSLSIPAARLGLLLVTTILLTLSSCQAYKVRKRTADEHLLALQQGVLLVRLQTGERKAEALRQMGKTAEAEAVLRDQEVFNDSVRAAFARRYDFSPVFFFFAPESGRIRERALSDVLSTAQGKTVPNAEITGKSFLAAEFGEVQAPAANAGLDALYLMDDQLRQLDAPFPFAVPTHLYSEEELVDRAVARLNLKLREFAARASYRVRRRELRELRRGVR